MAKKKQTFDIFLRTLSQTTWSADTFKKWKGNNRSFEPVILKFISLNSKYLNFLGIDARLITENNEPKLQLTSSKYIGAIPILAPDTGLKVGVLTVGGRYGENPEEILPLIKHSLRPEYIYDWPLGKELTFNPPVFMECCSFIDLFIELNKRHWTKFSKEKEISKRPSAGTNWLEYAIRTATQDQKQKLIFHNSENRLICLHQEQKNLNYVCRLAIEILSRPNVPVTIRYQYAGKLQSLRTLLINQQCLKTTFIKTHSADPVIVKEIKKLANIILEEKGGEKYSWRLDYAEVFERYVQYLFEEAGKKQGFSTRANQRIQLNWRRRPAWKITNLEPDLVLYSDDKAVIVDAKYKSHIYNWNDFSKELHDTFRLDLHQILAYASIIGETHEISKVVLAYPYNKFTCERLTISDGLIIELIGIPISRAQVPPLIQSLTASLRRP